MTATTQDMIQFFNDNPDILSEFLANYMQANPTTPNSQAIMAYLEANPSVIGAYINANPGLVTEFIEKSAPELKEFVKQNPELVSSLLNEAVKSVPNPFGNVLVSAFGYDLTVERLLLIGIPVLFCIILYFQKNIFSYAMILLWVIIGAITGFAAYGITKLPEMFRPVARLAGAYLGSIAVGVFGLLSILVIILGITTGMVYSAGNLFTPHAQPQTPQQPPQPSPATLVPK